MSKYVTGYNRSWKAILIANFLFLSFNGEPIVLADGNIGCLFADNLCLDNVEWCFDDYAFGKCLQNFGLDPDETAREPLGEKDSHILASMLEELQGAGLGWEDLFVQCRMQGAIFSIRNKVPMPANLCANLAPNPRMVGQSPEAVVRFSPPSNKYADEVYYPPNKKNYKKRAYLDDDNEQFDPITYQAENRFGNAAPYMGEENISPFSAYDDAVRERDLNEKVQNRIKDIKHRIELKKMFAEYEAGNLKPPHYYRDGIVGSVQNADNDADSAAVATAADYNDDDDYTEALLHSGLKRTLSSEYEKTQSDNEQIQPKKTVFREKAREDPGVYIHQKENHAGFVSDNNNELPSEGGVYTEGGLVFVPGPDNALDRKLEARKLLENMLSFTRHERLDVKKPGPAPSPPEQPLEKAKPSDPQEPSSGSARNEKKSDEKSADKSEITKEVLPAHIKDNPLPKLKKDIHNDDNHAPHSVDSDYTYVYLKPAMDSWSEGSRILYALADMMNMHDYFTALRVDRHEITFRVEDNPEKKTAEDVARAINDNRFRTNLSRRLGVTVLGAGIGNKTKNSGSLFPERVAILNGPPMTHVVAFIMAGAGLAAIVVIIITVYLLRGHDKKRDKLGDLQSGLAGAETCSKDYQDLCRARMSGKGNNGNDGTSSSGRIVALSQENDRPPSSRSSTSSWSEEPALTNMDISTGHMVLSYMEDHLRNKGRLQREWEALCRYEAEPNAREAALQSECAPLNRPGAPLPFDHSRVMLNYLANAEGLDYINASTITDHDPRAPAYVAAQGPLPTTLAHFWQMIWEQGAVVIVALCRLQENGEIACARYWPEEGAEVYHIYEVHLVSEHIWCDDYLVRSFYLKNLRTGETRTVTQFHFLSWPQAGVPAQAKALLEFRRKVNKSYRGRSCPIVVHGSAGAGRTGAYILLDLVLGRMNKGAREIDIAATLEHLRDQRAGLVATRQQFEFVLMAVAEEVHAILKALPANTQPEKRDFDKDAIKEQDNETDDKTETTKEQPKTDKDSKGT